MSSFTNFAIIVIGGLLRPELEDADADQELHEHPDDEADDDTEEDAAATLCCASTNSLRTLLVAILVIFFQDRYSC